MRFIILIIFSISCISLLDATERKQPGVKYSDTLKQKRADKAASEGRVVPKQSGVNYLDTLRQVENNKREAEGKVMFKIPGQNYSDTLKGVAKSNDNKEIKKYREELKKEAEKLRKDLEKGDLSSKSKLTESLKNDLILWNRYIKQLDWQIFQLEQAERYGMDNFREKTKVLFEKYFSLENDEIWNYIIQVELNRLSYSSLSYINFFEDIEKLEGEKRKEFMKDLVWPMNMDYQVQLQPFEFHYKKLIIKYLDEGKDKKKSIELAQLDFRKLIRNLADESCLIDRTPNELVLKYLYEFEGNLQSSALKIFKKLNFEDLTVIQVRCN